MKLTVLMSVFNADRYLQSAIDSILNQTFSDFEFLIINDGSTDNTSKILASYYDTRIRIVDNEHNIGLTKSLNKGLEISRGEYIARMDADDISLPDRLGRQMSFLDSTSHIHCVGCDNFIIDENRRETGQLKWPHGRNANIRAIASSTNPVGHPNVIYRKDVVMRIGKYNEFYPTCQDLELWFRFYKHGYLTDNVPRRLLMLRKHHRQISCNNDERILIPRMFDDFVHDLLPDTKLKRSMLDLYLQYYLWRDNTINFVSVIFCILFHKYLEIKISKRLNLRNKQCPKTDYKE